MAGPNTGPCNVIPPHAVKLNCAHVFCIMFHIIYFVTVMSFGRVYLTKLIFYRLRMGNVSVKFCILL